MAWSLPEGSVLGLWGERPDAGSKPGLIDGLGAELSEVVAEAALFDRIDTWDNVRILAPGGRRVFVFGPDDTGPWFDERIPASFALQPQGEGRLAQRIKGFFDGEFAEGASKVVLLVGDAPTLDPTIVVSAFLCLDSRDLVIGPRADGGVYLIGARITTPPVFDDATWSEVGQLAGIVGLLSGTRFSSSILPPWYGLETPSDWATTVAHLKALKLSGMEPGLLRLEGLAGC
jgi:glycosyltransferase A (GT-A) superfamily protein (DUF2064 family)